MKKSIKSAWTTSKEIKDLKAKISLREKDDASFLCEAKQQITSIEQRQIFLKNDVSTKRRELARCLNGDKEVIITALHDSPLDQLTYQRGTADKCIAEKNQDVFDQVKRLNSVRHKLNMKQQKIDELNLTLRNLKHQEKPAKMVCSTDDESEQRIRILSTKLDKILLKINSARYVNTTYKRLLAYLEKDSLSLPGRLDNLESNLENQKKELVSLRITAKEARRACENTRKQRSVLESEIMSDKSIRDKKLTNIKRNLKEIQDEAENLNLAPIINRKKDGNRKGQASESTGRMNTFNNHRKLQKEALSASLNILKETVGASKVEDIAVNFQTQLQTQQDLLGEAEALQKSRENLVSRLYNEEESLKTSKYEASIALESDANLDHLKSADKMSLVKAKAIEDQLNEMDRNIRSIVSAINVYYRKACILKAVPCNEDLPYETKMKVILDQFSALARRRHSNLILLDEIPTDSIREKIQFDLLLTTTNQRVQMMEVSEDGELARNGQNTGAERATEKQSLFNDEDEELDASYFSREEIKKKANEIMIQARPKKGKKGR